MLMAFGPGLIPFSAQYLMLRGFYAYEDTKTPFTVSIWIAGLNSVLSLGSYYVLGSTRWAVTGMCVGYVVAYTIGMVITGKRLSRKLGGIDTSRVVRTHAKLIAASLAGGAAGAPVAFWVSGALGQQPLLSSTASLAAGGGIFIGLFLLASRKMHIEEVDSLLGALRSRFGR